MTMLRIKRIIFGLSTRDVNTISGVPMANIRKVETLSDDLIKNRGLLSSKQRLETMYSNVYKIMSEKDKDDFDAAVRILSNTDFHKYIEPLFNFFDDGTNEGIDDD